MTTIKVIPDTFNSIYWIHNRSRWTCVSSFTLKIYLQYDTVYHISVYEIYIFVFFLFPVFTFVPVKPCCPGKPGVPGKPYRGERKDGWYLMKIEEENSLE